MMYEMRSVLQSAKATFLHPEAFMIERSFCKFSQFRHIGRNTAVKEIAGPVIPQILIPQSAPIPVTYHFVDKPPGPRPEVVQRSKDLRGIAEALPVALQAGFPVVRSREFSVPELAQIFRAAVSAGEGVAVLCIDKEKFPASPAGVRTGRVTIVLPDQCQQGTSGREDPEAGTKFGDYIKERFENDHLLVR